jgi:hypothetical protein
MSPGVLTFTAVAGSRVSTRRALGFLEGHPELDAGVLFDDLKENGKYTVTSRFDLWLDGGICDKYFHGFKNDSELNYRNCFVFKWKQHRWYGFLCHPQPKSDPSFLLCILTIHAIKKEHETDRAELERVCKWQRNLGSTTAIARVYPEYGAYRKWAN